MRGGRGSLARARESYMLLGAGGAEKVGGSGSRVGRGRSPGSRAWGRFYVVPPREGEAGRRRSPRGRGR